MLLNSPYEMSFFRQLANLEGPGRTAIRCSTSWHRTPIRSTTYGEEHIEKTLKKELQRYIDFERRAICSNAARICRPISANNCSSIRSEAGNGDRKRPAEFQISLSLESYCQTFIDVVTIEESDSQCA